MKKFSLFCVAALFIGGSGLSVAMAAGEGATKAKPAPVPAKGGVVAISPTNTHVKFVGTHNNKEKPDPRVGTFTKFSGQAELDAAGKTLKAMTVEFDTTSIATQFDKLTNHLKSPDFFDVREYPKAKFESTEITAGEDGESTVKGNLTLHGKTKEVSFPLKTTVSNAGVTAEGSFKIKQSDFGMDKMLQGVVDEVELSVVIGRKNEAPAAP